MNYRTRLLLPVGLGLGLALFVFSAGMAIAQAVSTVKGLSPLQNRHVSGVVSVVHDSYGAASQGAVKASALIPFALSESDSTCGAKRGSNVKVNQNCLNLSDSDLQGRSQAQNETSIAQDPNAPNHLVASFNDYRRGDGTCGAAWSVDGGETWQDSTVPNGFFRGAAYGGVARQYFQAGGDTAVAWDTKGNAYLQCQLFMRGAGVTNNPDASSAVYVLRSTGNHGASWNFTARPVVETFDLSGAILEDKPFMTVDNTVGSPYQDRIYVTWTEFAADGTGYIWAARSNDYGESFSPRVLVSSMSSLCTNTFGVPTPQGNCNENQYSQPFAGPDGALYVVYANFNNTVTGSDNRNQMLLVKSTDGGVSFSAPVKVADYYDLPDCVTYQGQDAFRACVPEKGPSTNSYFRASNYPSGAVDPTNKMRIVVAFGSYIGPHSNEGNGCVPAGFSGTTGINLFTGVKTTGACKNDILVSVSTNGGASFTGTTTDPRTLLSAAPTPAQSRADQWFQWLAFKKNGGLAVSYYDRQYGNDETTGFSDVSVFESSSSGQFVVSRATSSSLPPPTEFSGLFWGDYAGLTALDQAHPIWSDTRAHDLFLCSGTGVVGVPPAVCTAPAFNAAVANDQDVYSVSIRVPSDD